MSRILENEIQQLERTLLLLSVKAEENLHDAIKSVLERDLEVAETVIENDAEIDRMEVELEEECLKVLALHQPVAVDLRFIVAILKINNDLERVGDLATSIAKRATTLVENGEIVPPFEVSDMAGRAWSMIRKSLDALVKMDTDMAREIGLEDLDLDKQHRENTRTIEAAVKTDPTHISAYMAYLWISRALERIGDHATNIGEDVVYLLKGEIVRHGKKALPPQEAEDTRKER